MEMIQSKSLTRKFGDLTAVQNLDLSIQKGEIFGLVGPDGAGKTTTMRLLSSILDPTSGTAKICGFDTVKEAEILKEHIGYMSQQFGLYTDLTVEENIRFYADIYCIPKKERQEKMEKLLHFSNLTPFKRRLAGNLSGGMKQKLGLACSLIHTPQVLFLDEPTSGVDPVSRRDFWQILSMLLKEKVTILLSTSYMDEAERCSRVGFIDKGKLLASGTPREMKKLVRRVILEVRVENTRKAIHYLNDLFGERDVRLFGNKIHIVTDTPEESHRKIVDSLTKAGMGLADVRRAEPSLEDVFISVLGKYEKEEKNGGL